MSVFQTIACLLVHAPIEAAFSSSFHSEINESQNTNLIPGWDQWLHPNSVSTRRTDNVGRVRGEAWGVSNPITNFRSVAGADFFFRFVIPAGQVIVDGGLYEFKVDIRLDGEFNHRPAIAFEADFREPPARTFSQVSTRLRALVIDAQGSVVSSERFPPVSDIFTIREAIDGFFDETLNTRIPHSQEIALPAGRHLMFSAKVRIAAAATGSSSRCRVRGRNDRFRFRVSAENARIQKVLQRADACFDVLNA